MSLSLQVTQVVWGPHPEDDLEPPDFTKASCRPPSAATNAPAASSGPPLRLRAYPSRLALVVSGGIPRRCGAGCRSPTANHYRFLFRQQPAPAGPANPDHQEPVRRPPIGSAALLGSSYSAASKSGAMSPQVKLS
ncbi:PREDICTED: uncharacterized protein LOC105522750 [Colobus angolensis palliatus]|uniref:uncharacterized protein LOC105522750 n=1 Tax=Colobus angolensis palliatus TaxID=336983 RepID=UPI0005F47516|nr:PREDICTED: uncharacterized protein LOC105522750 [Colobus angolensis palliatus]